MKNTAKIETAVSRCPRRRAYSLLEILMAVAILSSVAAGAYLLIGGTHQAAQSNKLRSDITSINNAVRTYLVHGGSISSAATANEVLSKLKSTADKSSSDRVAGLRHTMLDPRLRGILATAPGA